MPAEIKTPPSDGVEGRGQPIRISQRHGQRRLVRNISPLRRRTIHGFVTGSVTCEAVLFLKSRTFASHQLCEIKFTPYPMN